MAARGQPRRVVSPVISSTTQACVASLLLALPPRPWPPCCDTLPPLDAHHMLCSEAGCRRSYVLADDKVLCRLLPTCQPWNPTPRPLHWGRGARQEAKQASKHSNQLSSHPAKLSSAFFFPPLPSPGPCSKLPHERKNRAGAQSQNRVDQAARTKKKGVPRSVLVVPSPPPAYNYSRLAPFGEYLPIVDIRWSFGSTVRPLN